MPEVCDLTKEGAAEGRSDNWGEVVTRQPYRKVRLDHLLSKEEEVGVVLLSSYQGVSAIADAWKIIANLFADNQECGSKHMSADRAEIGERSETISV